MTQKKNTNTDMNGPDIVLWFDDLGTGNEENRFLSNFYEGEPITLPGVTWDNLLTTCGVDLSKGLPLSIHKMLTENNRLITDHIEFQTGEHAFAAMKFWSTDWTHFRDIVEAKGPNPAKALGRSRQHPLRKNWEEVKYDVMLAVTRAKYKPGRDEHAMLLGTGTRLLVEGTYWYDDVWGVDLNAAGAPGRNWLGTILMARRAELQALMAYPDSGFVKHFVSDTGNWNAVEACR